MLYLDSFNLYLEDRQVYPYSTTFPMGLECINFAPITIFYGNNGSGKSTVLNVIASKLGIRNKTLGNTSEYFDGYVRRCVDVQAESPIPDDSMFIRSEDIMEFIAGIRKKNATIDKTVKGWLTKGTDRSIKGTLEGEMYVKDEFENIYEHNNSNSSFYNAVKHKLFEKNEELSNGETAIDYFKDRLYGDNLYFLDEPENSMSPTLQLELANYICLLAYRMNSQFVIATHSPFLLSMDRARIYDLDSRPSVRRQWYELGNMKVFYNLFRRFKNKFEI